MPDILGYRAKIGVLVPQTNTVVESEYHAMAPRGVSINTGRMAFGQQNLEVDQPDDVLAQSVHTTLEPFVRQLMSCAPAHFIMGMSAPSYWGGRDGCRAFGRRLTEQAGVPVTTAGEALDRALDTLGARRVAILTPYRPAITARVERFLRESDYDVRRTMSMSCPNALSIAAVTEIQLRDALGELDGDDLDAIVQSGTNLPMVRLADEAERWLGKPVVAINTAMLWDALRRLDLPDQQPGFGSLLRDH